LVPENRNFHFSITSNFIYHLTFGAAGRDDITSNSCTVIASCGIALREEKVEADRVAVAAAEAALLAQQKEDQALRRRNRTKGGQKVQQVRATKQARIVKQMAQSVVESRSTVDTVVTSTQTTDTLSVVSSTNTAKRVKISVSGVMSSAELCCVDETTSTTVSMMSNKRQRTEQKLDSGGGSDGDI